MIEQIMYFALGALVAALGTIALLPALWRRAVRLTRARLEATLPVTPSEIAAEKDSLRASYVVDLRRIELEREAAEKALQAAKADIGAKLTVMQIQDETIASHAETIALLRKEGDDLRATLAARDDRITTLETERDNLATNLSASRISNQALDQQALNLRQTAEQANARVAELDAQLEATTARLADSVAATTRLRDEVQTKGDELRQAARQLREAAAHIAQTERRLAAVEGLAQDRLETIEELQAERMKLIEENGQIGRERDHERVERQALATQARQLADRVTQAQEMAETQVAHLRAELESSTLSAQSTSANHVRAMDDLRIERLNLQDELARLKRETSVARDALEAEIRQLRVDLEHARAHAASSQEVVRDLTRTIDGLKHDRRLAEDELSAIRLERTATEQELIRLRRIAPEKGEAAAMPPRPIAAVQPGETQA